MKIKQNCKYVVTPVRILMTAFVIIIALPILQLITVEITSVLQRPYRTPVEQTEGLTKEEKRLRRIKHSLKQVLPDGTIHLVHQPGRDYYYQWEDSAEEHVYDTNDNLLWKGTAKENPYKYLSWSTHIRYESLYARRMGLMQVINPRLSQTLEIPVRSKKETLETWRYAPKSAFFTGYVNRGAKIGYLGATGFEDSIAAVCPLGEFAAFFAWCPKESFSPSLVWQTKRRIYEINFERRETQLLFESPDADIEGIYVHTWGSFRPNEVKPVPGYRSLLQCRTEDGKDHLIIRGMTRPLTIEMPEERNIWCDGGSHRFTATEQGIFMNRLWVVSPPRPKDEDFTSPRHSQELWRQYRAGPKEFRADIYKVDDRGALEPLSHFTWTVPGEDLTDATALRWISGREKMHRCVNQFSPPLYDFLYHLLIKCFWSPDSYRSGEGAVLWFVSGFEQLRPGFTVWNWLLVALMVAFAYRHARPRCMSRHTLVFWLVFVGLFNLAGLLTYLALNHTPVIECPACGKKRGLNQPECARCHADLPAPKPGRLDLILDTKPTT